MNLARRIPQVAIVEFRFDIDHIHIKGEQQHNQYHDVDQTRKGNSIPDERTLINVTGPLHF